MALFTFPSKGSSWGMFAIVAGVLAAAGCTLDFSQFPTDASANDMRDAGNDIELGPPSDMPPGDRDVDDDMPDGNNMPSLPLGQPCADDAECDAGICRLGICTATCTQDDDCPDDGFCGTPTGDSICVPACGSAACDLGETACFDVSTLAGADQPGCLPDGDGDGVVDIADNCPEDANKAQRDLDADGEGDVCDGDPLCAAGHTDGVLDLGSLPMPADTALPGYATDWFPAMGGVGSEQMDSDALGLFDRATGATTSSILPYAASDFGLVQVGPNEFVSTPGAFGQGPQFGRFLHVFRDGTVRQGNRFEPEASAPVLAAGPDGRLWMLSFLSATTNAYRVYRYDTVAERFQALNGASDGERMEWSVFRDTLGTMYFYSTIHEPLLRLGRFLEVDPDANSAAIRNVQYPNLDDGTPFDPFILPATAGRFHIWDRGTGRAFVWDGVAFTAVPQLSVTVELTDTDWIAQPSGLGFVVTGRDDAAAAGELRAIAYSLACFPQVAELDADADGTNDLLDVCPNDDRVTTEDLDGDGFGDVCDDDADGDGLEDSSDPSLRDTDNDGETNDVDADDDADGIADDRDLFPLDTDNDGIVNALDNDDDDDGSPDAAELNAGTNPVDPLDFPSAGTVVWVANDRVLLAPLHDTANPQALQRRGTNAPNIPRFAVDGQWVLMLDGEPGNTSRLEFSSLSAPGELHELGVVTWGADILRSTQGVLEEVVVAHARETDPMKVDLSTLEVGEGFFSPIVTVLTGIEAPDTAAGNVAFVGQPAGCSDCRAAYAVSRAGGVPRIIAPEVSNPTHVRYSGGVVTLLGDAADGTGTSAWFGSEDDLEEMRPPGATDVSAAIGYPDGNLVAVSTDDGGSALWFFNGSKRRWHRLTDLPEATDDLDWAR